LRSSQAGSGGKIEVFDLSCVTTCIMPGKLNALRALRLPLILFLQVKNVLMNGWWNEVAVGKWAPYHNPFFLPGATKPGTIKRDAALQ